MPYNIGDVFVFELLPPPTGDFTYTWLWWDNTVDVTAVPSITKVLNQGGNLTVTLIQSNPDGWSTNYVIGIVVNQPPVVIGSPTISANDAIFPFATTMTSVSYDPEHPGGTELSFGWFDGATSLGGGSTSIPSAGTYQNSLTVSAVTTNKTYSQVITDTANGVTRVNYSVRGSAPTGLHGSGSSQGVSIVSSANNIGSVIIGPNQSVTFSVFAQDSSPGQLQFAWTLKAVDGWAADFSVTDTPAVLPNGSFKDQVTRSISAETAGQKVANCVVTNLSTGQSITIRNTVQLVAAQSPVITGITTDAPLINSALVVSQAGFVRFAAVANDPNNAILTYRWDFTQPPTTLYGKSILLLPAQYSVFNEAALESGGPRPILGALTVTDRYGKFGTAQITDFAGVQVFPFTQVPASTSGTGPGAESTTGGGAKNVYFGVSPDPAITNNELSALSINPQNTRSISVTLSPAAQYIYFAFPVSFGAATFNLNGMLDTGWISTVRAFNNDTYNIYRSINVMSGSSQIVVS